MRYLAFGFREIATTSGSQFNLYYFLNVLYWLFYLSNVMACEHVFMVCLLFQGRVSDCSGLTYSSRQVAQIVDCLLLPTVLLSAAVRVPLQSYYTIKDEQGRGSKHP